jgi:hypothetical protein
VVLIEYVHPVTAEVHERLTKALGKSIEGTGVRLVLLAKGMRVARIDLTEPEKG